jgi:hypothetical protein
MVLQVRTGTRCGPIRQVLKSFESPMNVGPRCGLCTLSKKRPSLLDMSGDWDKSRIFVK